MTELTALCLLLLVFGVAVWAALAWLANDAKTTLATNPVQRRGILDQPPLLVDWPDGLHCSLDDFPDYQGTYLPRAE